MPRRAYLRRASARVGLLSLLLGTALAAGSAPLSSSAATVDSLTAGHALTAGQSLVSSDGLNTLVMQSDGNLVEYSAGTPIWCSNTNGKAPGGHVTMETSGSAVIYTSSGTAVWSSGSTGTGSANRLRVQDDGNVVVYTSGGSAVYSATARATTLFPGGRLRSGQSLYSVNEDFRATMQADGNFVLYRGGSALWASGTRVRAAGGSVVMGTDGSLVVYSAGGSPVWSSGTGTAGSMLVMQDDANLVMYGPLSNTAPWSSHTYDGTPMTPQHYARQYMLANYHWGPDKFDEVDYIFFHESGWRSTAINPIGGNPATSAYGIPQALPGSKMASAGADWATNFKTQVRWGLGYIRERYGNPLVAYAFWLSHHWYITPR